MVTVDLLLELSSIIDSQSVMEKFLVAGNLGLMVGDRIVLLPLVPS